jgi:hypothetical protein
VSNIAFRTYSISAPAAYYGKAKEDKFDTSMPESQRLNSTACDKRRSSVMFASLKFGAFAASIILSLGITPNRGSALTVEVARKCEALTAKAFPPREPGNPAAGSTKGSGRSQHEYFNKCVANGGKMDDSGAK